MGVGVILTWLRSDIIDVEIIYEVYGTVATMYSVGYVGTDTVATTDDASQKTVKGEIVVTPTRLVETTNVVSVVVTRFVEA